MAVKPFASWGVCISGNHWTLFREKSWRHLSLFTSSWKPQWSFVFIAVSDKKSLSELDLCSSFTWRLGMVPQGKIFSLLDCTLCSFAKDISVSLHHCKIQSYWWLAWDFFQVLWYQTTQSDFFVLQNQEQANSREVLWLHLPEFLMWDLLLQNQSII